MALAMIEAEVISALERPYLLAKDCRSPPPESSIGGLGKDFNYTWNSGHASDLP